MTQARYRWTAAHAAEGLCGDGHRLTRDGCRICGPTVYVPPQRAAPHLKRGHLVRVEQAKPAAAPADVDELLDDIERQSRANAALQEEVSGLRLSNKALEGDVERLSDELAAASAENSRLRAQLVAYSEEAAGEPQPLTELLDALDNTAIVALAEQVRVDADADDIKPFGARAHKRARAYLVTADPVTVRLLIDERR